MLDMLLVIGGVNVLKDSRDRVWPTLLEGTFFVSLFFRMLAESSLASCPVYSLQQSKAPLRVLSLWLGCYFSRENPYFG